MLVPVVQLVPASWVWSGVLLLLVTAAVEMLTAHQRQVRSARSAVDRAG